MTQIFTAGPDKCSQFDCRSGFPKCIPHIWVCDGESECGDNNDESIATCNEYTNVTNWTYRHGTCGGNFSTMNGIFTSPAYPNNYPDNAYCVYAISLQDGTSILLNFVKVHIESPDYLEIRDGPSEASPLLNKISRNEYPASLQSSQNHMWIK